MSRKRSWPRLLALAAAFFLPSLGACREAERLPIEFQLIDEWGGEEIFHDPFSLIATAEGLFVAESYLGQVIQIDFEGNVLRRIGQDTLISPTSVLLDPDGNLLVSDSNQDRIFVFSPNQTEQVLDEWPARAEDQPSAPIALAWSPDRQAIYALEFSTHRVSVFDRQGRLVNRWGEEGMQVGQFYFAGGLAVAEDGRVLVADTHNQRIQVFSPRGEFLRAFGDREQFHDPAGLAFDAAGRLFVADSGNHRIQIWSAEGRHIATYSDPSWQGSEVATPLDLAFDDQGNLWVLDIARRTVQKFGGK